MAKPFATKVNQRGNKLLLRDFALADGLPDWCAFRPKLPLKKKGFDSKEHLKILVKRFLTGETYEKTNKGKK
jgi:hypothetical protein